MTDTMRRALATRKISHDEAAEIAQRFINSHFRQEPHARISIPVRMDYDDDLLITAYIEQQRALAREQAGDGWKRRINELVEIINAGERLGTRINGRFILDRDRVWAFLQGDAPTAAPSPAKPDAEPANYDLLHADAKARQRGENLDGSPRRETIPHDASAEQLDDRFVAGWKAGREAAICAIRSAPSLDENGYIAEKSKTILAIRALPAPGSETEMGGGT